MDQEFSDTFDLPTFLRAQEDREATAGKLISEELSKGQIPTPEPVVRSIVWRVDRHKLMRHHAFAQEHRIRNGLDALISAALAAHLDLSRAEAALTAFAQTHDTFDDHIAQTVENPAQKEVMAFCNAYVGTVDTLRRLEARRADIWPDIEALRKTATDGVLFRFIYELRRNLSHGSVVVPYWNIRSDETGTNGTINFSAGELLAFGDWNTKVRTYLSAMSEDSFSISAITGQCAASLAKFRRELNILFARHRTDAERDFHAINDLSRRLGSKSLNQIVLKQVVAKGVNPYAHLHRFFSPEEVGRILEYPANSVEQVEYIIRLREAKTLIDPATRALLYQLFSVPVDFEVPVESPSILPKALGALWPY